MPVWRPNLRATVVCTGDTFAIVRVFAEESTPPSSPSSDGRPIAAAPHPRQCRTEHIAWQMVPAKLPGSPHTRTRALAHGEAHRGTDATTDSSDAGTAAGSIDAGIFFKVHGMNPCTCYDVVIDAQVTTVSTRHVDCGTDAMPVRPPAWHRCHTTAHGVTAQSPATIVRCLSRSSMAFEVSVALHSPSEPADIAASSPPAIWAPQLEVFDSTTGDTIRMVDPFGSAELADDSSSPRPPKTSVTDHGHHSKSDDERDRRIVTVRDLPAGLLLAVRARAVFVIPSIAYDPSAHVTSSEVEVGDTSAGHVAYETSQALFDSADAMVTSLFNDSQAAIITFGFPMGSPTNANDARRRSKAYASNGQGRPVAFGTWSGPSLVRLLPVYQASLRAEEPCVAYAKLRHPWQLNALKTFGYHKNSPLAVSTMLTYIRRRVEEEDQREGFAATTTSNTAASAFRESLHPRFRRSPFAPAALSVSAPQLRVRVREPASTTRGARRRRSNLNLQASFLQRRESAAGAATPSAGATSAAKDQTCADLPPRPSSNASGAAATSPRLGAAKPPLGSMASLKQQTPNARSAAPPGALSPSALGMAAAAGSIVGEEVSSESAAADGADESGSDDSMSSLSEGDLDQLARVNEGGDDSIAHDQAGSSGLVNASFSGMPRAATGGMTPRAAGAIGSPQSGRQVIFGELGERSTLTNLRPDTGYVAHFEAEYRFSSGAVVVDTIAEEDFRTASLLVRRRRDAAGSSEPAAAVGAGKHPRRSSKFGPTLNAVSRTSRSVSIAHVMGATSARRGTTLRGRGPLSALADGPSISGFMQDGPAFDDEPMEVVRRAMERRPEFEDLTRPDALDEGAHVRFVDNSSVDLQWAGEEADDGAPRRNLVHVRVFECAPGDIAPPDAFLESLFTAHSPRDEAACSPQSCGAASDVLRLLDRKRAVLKRGGELCQRLSTVQSLPPSSSSSSSSAAPVIAVSEYLFVTDEECSLRLAGLRPDRRHWISCRAATVRVSRLATPRDAAVADLVPLVQQLRGALLEGSFPLWFPWSVPPTTALTMREAAFVPRGFMHGTLWLAMDAGTAHIERERLKTMSQEEVAALSAIMDLVPDSTAVTDGDGGTEHAGDSVNVTGNTFAAPPSLAFTHDLRDGQTMLGGRPAAANDSVPSRVRAPVDIVPADHAWHALQATALLEIRNIDVEDDQREVAVVREALPPRFCCAGDGGLPRTMCQDAANPSHNFVFAVEGLSARARYSIRPRLSLLDQDAFGPPGERVRVTTCDGSVGAVDQLEPGSLRLSLALPVAATAAPPASTKPTGSGQTTTPSKPPRRTSLPAPHMDGTAAFMSPDSLLAGSADAASLSVMHSVAPESDREGRAAPPVGWVSITDEVSGQTVVLDLDRWHIEEAAVTFQHLAPSRYTFRVGMCVPARSSAGAPDGVHEVLRDQSFFEVTTLHRRAGATASVTVLPQLSAVPLTVGSTFVIAGAAMFKAVVEATTATATAAADVDDGDPRTIAERTAEQARPESLPERPRHHPAKSLQEAAADLRDDWMKQNSSPVRFSDRRPLPGVAGLVEGGFVLPERRVEQLVLLHRQAHARRTANWVVSQLRKTHTRNASNTVTPRRESRAGSVSMSVGGLSPSALASSRPAAALPPLLIPEQMVGGVVFEVSYVCPATATKEVKTFTWSNKDLLDRLERSAALSTTKPSPSSAGAPSPSAALNVSTSSIASSSVQPAMAAAEAPGVRPKAAELHPMEVLLGALPPGVKVSIRARPLAAKRDMIGSRELRSVAAFGPALTVRLPPTATVACASVAERSITLRIANPGYRCVPPDSLKKNSGSGDANPLSTSQRHKKRLSRSSKSFVGKMAANVRLFGEFKLAVEWGEEGVKRGLPAPNAVPDPLQAPLGDLYTATGDIELAVELDASATGGGDPVVATFTLPWFATTVVVNGLLPGLRYVASARVLPPRSQPLGRGYSEAYAEAQPSADRAIRGLTVAGMDLAAWRGAAAAQPWSPRLGTRTLCDIAAFVDGLGAHYCAVSLLRVPPATEELHARRQSLFAASASRRRSTSAGIGAASDGVVEDVELVKGYEVCLHRCHRPRPGEDLEDFYARLSRIAQKRERTRNVAVASPAASTHTLELLGAAAQPVGDDVGSPGASTIDGTPAAAPAVSVPSDTTPFHSSIDAPLTGPSAEASPAPSILSAAANSGIRFGRFTIDELHPDLALEEVGDIADFPADRTDAKPSEFRDLVADVEYQISGRSTLIDGSCGDWSSLTRFRTRQLPTPWPFHIVQDAVVGFWTQAKPEPVVCINQEQQDRTGRKQTRFVRDSKAVEVKFHGIFVDADKRSLLLPFDTFAMEHRDNPFAPISRVVRLDAPADTGDDATAEAAPRSASASVRPPEDDDGTRRRRATLSRPTRAGASVRLLEEDSADASAIASGAPELEAPEVWRVTGLVPGAAYRVTARFLDSRGEWSAWGPAFEVRTLPMPHALVVGIGESFAVINAVHEDWPRAVFPDEANFGLLADGSRATSRRSSLDSFYSSVEDSHSSSEDYTSDGDDDTTTAPTEGGHDEAFNDDDESDDGQGTNARRPPPLFRPCDFPSPLDVHFDLVVVPTGAVSFTDATRDTFVGVEGSAVEAANKTRHGHAHGWFSFTKLQAGGSYTVLLRAQYSHPTVDPRVANNAVRAGVMSVAVVHELEAAWKELSKSVFADLVTFNTAPRIVQRLLRVAPTSVLLELGRAEDPEVALMKPYRGKTLPERPPATTTAAAADSFISAEYDLLVNDTKALGDGQTFAVPLDPDAKSHVVLQGLCPTEEYRVSLVNVCILRHIGDFVEKCAQNAVDAEVASMEAAAAQNAKEADRFIPEEPQQADTGVVRARLVHQRWPDSRPRTGAGWIGFLTARSALNLRMKADLPEGERLFFAPSTMPATRSLPLRPLAPVLYGRAGEKLVLWFEREVASQNGVRRAGKTAWPSRVRHDPGSGHAQLAGVGDDTADSPSPAPPAAGDGDHVDDTVALATLGEQQMYLASFLQDDVLRATREAERAFSAIAGPLAPRSDVTDVFCGVVVDVRSLRQAAAQKKSGKPMPVMPASTTAASSAGRDSLVFEVHAASYDRSLGVVGAFAPVAVVDRPFVAVGLPRPLKDCSADTVLRVRVAAPDASAPDGLVRSLWSPAVAFAPPPAPPPPSKAYLEVDDATKAALVSFDAPLFPVPHNQVRYVVEDSGFASVDGVSGDVADTRHAAAVDRSWTVLAEGEESGLALTGLKFDRTYVLRVRTVSSFGISEAAAALPPFRLRRVRSWQVGTAEEVAVLIPRTLTETGPPLSERERLHDLPTRIANVVLRQQLTDESEPFDEPLPPAPPSLLSNVGSATTAAEGDAQQGGAEVITTAPRWRWPFPITTDADAFPPPVPTHLHFPTASGGAGSPLCRERRREGALMLFEGTVHMRPIRALAPASREEAVRSPSPDRVPAPLSVARLQHVEDGGRSDDADASGSPAAATLDGRSNRPVPTPPASPATAVDAPDRARMTPSPRTTRRQLGRVSVPANRPPILKGTPAASAVDDDAATRVAMPRPQSALAIATPSPPPRCATAAADAAGSANRPPSAADLRDDEYYIEEEWAATTERTTAKQLLLHNGATSPATATLTPRRPASVALHGRSGPRREPRAASAAALADDYGGDDDLDAFLVDPSGAAAPPPSGDRAFPRAVSGMDGRGASGTPYGRMATPRGRPDRITEELGFLLAKSRETMGSRQSSSTPRPRPASAAASRPGYEQPIRSSSARADTVTGSRGSSKRRAAAAATTTRSSNASQGAGRRISFRPSARVM